jgi:hypothetical protein
MRGASYRLTLFSILILVSSRLVLAQTAGEAGEEVTPPIDACALLQSTEVATAIAHAVEPAERGDSGYVTGGAFSSTCVWKVREPALRAPAPDAPMGGRHFVILNAFRWPAGKDLAKKFLESFYEAAKRGDIPHTPEPRKLGDDALWWGDGMAVRQGDVSFGVSVFVAGVSPQQAEKIEHDLAVRILKRVARSAGQF